MEKVKRYESIVTFRVSKGMLKGLELLARKRRIGVSELLRSLVKMVIFTNRGEK